jgi:hypothetical protein
MYVEFLGFSKMNKVCLVLIMLFTLSACNSNPAYVVTMSDSSSSQLMVTHHYTGAFDEPLNRDDAMRISVEQCKALGFNDAKNQGEPVYACDRYTGYYECLYRRAEQSYQCIE